jgi:hypothetical protein
MRPEASGRLAAKPAGRKRKILLDPGGELLGCLTGVAVAALPIGLDPQRNRAGGNRE